MGNLENEFLGTLSYKGGWCKTEDMLILEKQVKIDVVFSAYENEDLNMSQVKSYLWLEQNQEKVSHESTELMKKYLEVQGEEITAILDIKAMPEDINTILQPKTILIQEDGRIGILLKAAWDSHGAAILIEQNRNIEVGPEDIIW